MRLQLQPPPSPRLSVQSEIPSLPPITPVTPVSTDTGAGSRGETEEGTGGEAEEGTASPRETGGFFLTETGDEGELPKRQSSAAAGKERPRPGQEERSLRKTLRPNVRPEDVRVPRNPHVSPFKAGAKPRPKASQASLAHSEACRLLGLTQGREESSAEVPSLASGKTLAVGE